ncbi:hypothetical protein H8D36_01055 [archaeon]|nr:hypothetical protein [archaeon]
MGEGEVGEIQSKVVIRRNILRDVKYLMSKGLISEEEVYYLVKGFLKNYLKLNYEFTKDELFEELKNIYLPYNIRTDFFKFIDHIFLFEYSHAHYSDEELKSFLNEFRSYVDYLLTPSHEKKETGAKILLRKWSKRFFAKKLVVKEVVKEKTPLSLQSLTPVMANHIELNSLIEKVYYSLYNSDIDGASSLYKQAMTIYEGLSSEEKVIYYEPIITVYESIKKS